MRALYGAMLAAVVLAVGTGAAAAMTAEPAGEIAAVSLGRVTMRYGVTTIDCVMRLGGSLEEAIANVEGADFATFTSGTLNSCEHPNYEEWTLLFGGGGWPASLAEAVDLAEPAQGAITIDVRNVRIEWPLIPAGCLYAGDVIMTLDVSGSPLTSGLLAIPFVNLVRIPGRSVFCPSTLPLTGTLALEPTQTFVL